MNLPGAEITDLYHHTCFQCWVFNINFFLSQEGLVEDIKVTGNGGKRKKQISMVASSPSY
jgi:hypothetical protein